MLDGAAGIAAVAPKAAASMRWDEMAARSSGWVGGVAGLRMGHFADDRQV
ncbi:hypothetical protein ACQPXB_02645 [Amycolatopsis sp. CA-161197]